MPGFGGVSGLTRNGANPLWFWREFGEEMVVLVECRDGRAVSRVLLDETELEVVPLLELVTFRGARFGSKLFFPLFVEVAGPAFDEPEDGIGGMSSLTSCLTPLGVETEYNRTHWVERDSALHWS